MIVFDLHCPNGHRFEGWFGSSTDFDDQCARDLVNCPQCGSTNISKAPMAPAVPVKGNQKRIETSSKSVRAAPPPLPVGDAKTDKGATAANAPMPAEMKEALSQLAKAQSKALENSQWVGKDFVKQSREMHYGEREETAIHGQASLEEAKELAEEGVQVAPLPFPVAPPDELN